MSLLGKKKETCPICRSPVEPGATRCPKCNSALGPAPPPKAPAEDTSLDDILAGIMEDRSKGSMVKGKGDDLDLGLEEPPEPPKPAPAPKPAKPAQADVLEFVCPSCGSTVAEGSPKCPRCGATFAESDQFDCPVCGSAVPFEAVQCPKCGVRFVEEAGASAPLGLDPLLDLEPPKAPPASEPPVASPLPIPEPRPQPPAPVAPPSPPPVFPPSPTAAAPTPTPGILPPTPTPAPTPAPAPVDPNRQQRQLTDLVGELKALIVLGRRSNLGLGNATEVITQAVNLAKKRELGEAITFMVDAREALRRSFKEQVGGRLATLATTLERAGGKDGPAAQAVREARAKLQTEEIEGAVEAMERAQALMATGDPRAIQAKKGLERAKGALEEAKSMGIAVTGGDDLVTQASRAIGRGEWEGALGLTNQAWDLATGTVKNVLGEEMKRSRNMVFELKMKGEAVDRAIELLKQASGRLRDGDPRGAYQLLQAFRAEVPTSR